MTELSLTRALFDIFGGWPNFTEGSAGAIVGVLGAYLVAVYTSRKELRREQKRTRQEASVSAAGQMIREIAGLPQTIREIKLLSPTSSTGFSYNRVQAW